MDILSKRLLEYVTANKVEGAEKRRAILLSVVGASMHQLIMNLVAPKKLTEKTFGELVTLVQEHYQPSPSVIVQRFNLNLICVHSNKVNQLLPLYLS